MKIAAVIVTHNRISLLQDCVDILLKSTRKIDSIYVVNNGSTDDGKTKTWLDNNPFVIPIHQENVGAAGGFHTGLRKAYEDGNDWIWLMDDDGRPSVTALEKLIEATEKEPDGRVFNSIVIDKDDAKQDAIVFGYNVGMNVNDMSHISTYHSLAELRNTGKTIFDGAAQFFNASLLHRSIIEKVGYPDTRLFIRGDEVEYLFRIQKAGFKTYTVADSLMFHPKPSSKYIMIGKRKIAYYEPMVPFKMYHHIRNLIYINRKYKIADNRLKIIAFYVKELLFFSHNGYSISKVLEKFKTIKKAVKDGYELEIK